MRRKKEVDPMPDAKELRHFEDLFEQDKREAEERLALIRVRIRTLERAVAGKEGKWGLVN